MSENLNCLKDFAYRYSILYVKIAKVFGIDFNLPLQAVLFQPHVP